MFWTKPEKIWIGTYAKWGFFKAVIRKVHFFLFLTLSIADIDELSFFEQQFNMHAINMQGSELFNNIYISTGYRILEWDN